MKLKSDKKIQGNSEYESEQKNIWPCDTLGTDGRGWGEGKEAQISLPVCDFPI